MHSPTEPPSCPHQTVHFAVLEVRPHLCILHPPGGIPGRQVCLLGYAGVQEARGVGHQQPVKVLVLTRLAPELEQVAVGWVECVGGWGWRRRG